MKIVKIEDPNEESTIQIEYESESTLASMVEYVTHETLFSVPIDPAQADVQLQLLTEHALALCWMPPRGRQKRWTQILQDLT